MHIIRSEILGETLGETVGETFRAKKSRRESWIGLYAWLPARLSPRLIFLRGVYAMMRYDTLRYATLYATICSMISYATIRYDMQYLYLLRYILVELCDASLSSKAHITYTIWKLTQAVNRSALNPFMSCSYSTWWLLIHVPRISSLTTYDLDTLNVNNN